jgi:hypothetical protein
MKALLYVCAADVFIILFFCFPAGHSWLSSLEPVDIFFNRSLLFVLFLQHCVTTV